MLLRLACFVLCSLFPLAGCGEKAKDAGDGAKSAERRNRPAPTRIRFLNKSDRRVKFSHVDGERSVVMMVRAARADPDSPYYPLDRSYVCDNDCTLDFAEENVYTSRVTLKLWIETSTANTFVPLDVPSAECDASDVGQESFVRDIFIFLENDGDDYTARCYFTYDKDDDEPDELWHYQQATLEDVP